ncbi:MAG: polysaccharide deacetylase family protein [Hyphomonas sp.]
MTSLAKRIAHHAARGFVQHPVHTAFPEGMVSFCFDDFPKSAATFGASILEEQNLRGTFFPCASYAGQTVDGVRQFDTEDLMKLSEAGHEIGCHTADHARLPELSVAEMRKQFDDNAGYFKSLGLPAAQVHAYPFGDVSPRVKRCASQRFPVSRGAWAGVNAKKTDRALLKCVSLEAHILKERPIEYWITAAKNQQAWVIFLTHDIQVDHSYFGVSPKNFEATVAAVVDSGMQVLPIGAAFDQGILQEPQHPSSDLKQAHVR